MAGVRLRTRRRQFGWIRVVAVAAVALLGGAALWSGLSTSEAHAARQKLRSGAAQVGDEGQGMQFGVCSMPCPVTSLWWCA